MSAKQEKSVKELVVDRSESNDTPHSVTAREMTVRREAPGIEGILRMAVEKGMDAGSIDKLAAVFERTQDRMAAQEFAEAMAAFQSECPPIPKRATARITTKSGGSYSYKFAELDSIANAIRSKLKDHGLSYTWDSAEASGILTCTCVVRHINGHSVQAKFSCPTATDAAMSGAQKSAAGLTFARRQSLIAALGLTTCDPDNDGTAALKINEHQAANLSAKMDELKGEDKARMLTLLGVERASDVLATQFSMAISAVENKLRSYK